MRYLVFLAMWSVCGGLGWAESPPAMQEPKDFCHAGIRLSWPKGYRTAPLTEEFQVCLARRKFGTRPQESLTLSVFPIGEGQTVQALTAEVLESIQADPATRDLTVVKSTTVPVCCTEGQARSLTYVHRTVETSAVLLCFARSMPSGGPNAAVVPSANPAGGDAREERSEEPARQRLLYLLTMEATGDAREGLLREFDEVVQSAEFLPFRRPVECALPKLRTKMEHYSGGYSIRLPEGWIGQQNRMGVSLGVMDYVLGGVVCPIVQVVSGDVPAGTTAKQWARNALSMDQQQGASLEILSEGAVRLAGREAWQVVLRKKVPLPAMPHAVRQGAEDDRGEIPPAADRPSAAKDSSKIAAPAEAGEAADKPEASNKQTEADPVQWVEGIEVHRVLVEPGQDGGTSRVYAMVLACEECSADRAAAILEGISEGFVLLDRPAEKTAEAGPSTRTKKTGEAAETPAPKVETD